MVISAMGERRFKDLLSPLLDTGNEATERRLSAFNIAVSKLLFSAADVEEMKRSERDRPVLSRLREDFLRGAILVSSDCRDFWRKNRPFD
jgi:hypothetical protein